MNQKPKHTEPNPNSYAAAYGCDYRYNGFGGSAWASQSAAWSRTLTEHRSLWITDGSGNACTERSRSVNQHLQPACRRGRYLPYGEQFIDQRTNHDIRYKFTTKEEDSETGYQYFGARYYASDLSIWLSVDPLADKYPNVSSYMYVLGNPVRYTDPDGRWVKGAGFWNNIFKNDQRNKAELYAKGMRKQGYSTTITQRRRRDYDVGFQKKGKGDIIVECGVANFSKRKGKKGKLTKGKLTKGEGLGYSYNVKSLSHSQTRAFINTNQSFLQFQSYAIYGGGISSIPLKNGPFIFNITVLGAENMMKSSQVESIEDEYEKDDSKSGVTVETWYMAPHGTYSFPMTIKYVTRNSDNKFLGIIW